MLEFLRLLAGTVIYRPYVYAFFVCFLVFALRQLKPRATLMYLVMAYLIAFASEYSATRNGFPFGMYVYIDETRTRELWVSNVPFWDSLSFVFLSYFSWVTAAGLLGGRFLDHRAPWLAGLLMMLLDVVIDPVTLRGDRWFLGRIYYYPDSGSYFGVTLSNFAGWYFVGVVTVWVAQRLLGLFAQSQSPTFYRLALGVYAGIFFFNWGVTLWIREWNISWASAGVIVATLIPCARKVRALA